MLNRWRQYSVIRCFHSVLHKTPLYYETTKESSINIKKMPYTAKIAGFLFYFKKKFFELENLNSFPGGAQWEA